MGTPNRRLDYPTNGAMQTFDRALAERVNIIAEFRAQFAKYGFDVEKYSDDQISRTILSDPEGQLSESQRLACWFKRLGDAR